MSKLCMVARSVRNDLIHYMLICNDQINKFVSSWIRFSVRRLNAIITGQFIQLCKLIDVIEAEDFLIEYAHNIKKVNIRNGEDNHPRESGSKKSTHEDLDFNDSFIKDHQTVHEFKVLQT